jgi:PAS domain S-box-containing protein
MSNDDGKRHGPGPIAMAVFAAIAALSLMLCLVTRQFVSDQEQRLLTERRTEVAALLENSLAVMQSPLRVLAGVGALGQADDVALFERSAQPMVTGATQRIAVAVPDITGNFQVVVGVGPDAGVGTTLDATRTTLANRALETGKLVATQVTVGDTRRLIIAVAAGGGVRGVAFQEATISTAPIPPQPGTAYSELRVVLYSSTEADPAQRILSTELPGQEIVDGDEEILDIGAEKWLLVVAPRSSLVGGFAESVPWLLLAGGVVAAFLASAVADILNRRRDYAVALVDVRTAELKGVVTELAQAQTFLESLLNAGPVVVARTEGPDKPLSYISPNVERIFGYTMEQALTVGFISERIHDEDRDLIRQKMRELSETGTSPPSQELRFRHRNGEYRWVDLTLAVEESDPNEPDAIVIYVHDIDDRRKLEQAQRQAIEVAEAANRSKSEFLSRMSHELRTPLNAVIGFAQLLGMDDLNEEQHDGVRQIIRGGEHLVSLINEVLDIARIETGRLSVSIEPVRIDEVVNDAIDLVRPLANARSIEFPGSVGEACVCHVQGDRQRLKQVLLNLLGNAVKYNRDHGRVELTCQHMPNGRIRISVTDTGPGIAADKLALVFTPFERLDAEKTAVEGTGLGLALARGLADAMGGELGVESTVGQGTTFWIELDMVATPLEALEAQPQQPVTDDGSDTKTVLYIEDNLSNVRLVERILARRAHIRTIVAMQGELGVDLAREHQPDLVLLDLNLPDINGEEVLARLRSEPINRDVPVVIVSADATPRQIERLQASGATAYLTKPLDVDEFLRVIDEHLGTVPRPVEVKTINLPRAERARRDDPPPAPADGADVEPRNGNEAATTSDGRA